MDDLRGNVYHTLLERDGEIWAGTDRGLLHYQRYQWQLVIPDIAVNTIVSDAGGGLLLGTDQGLVRFDGDQSFFWIINLGDEVLVNYKVTSIAWDGKGQLWVGTDGHGLLRFNGKRWEQFNTASGLPTNSRHWGGRRRACPVRSLNWCYKCVINISFMTGHFHRGSSFAHGAFIAFYLRSFPGLDRQWCFAAFPDIKRARAACLPGRREWTNAPQGEAGRAILA
jgi:hypothetical protein